MPIKARATVTAACLNIQSFQHKIADILSDNVLCASNLLLLSETWCANNQLNPSLFPRFIGVAHVKRGRGLGLSAFSDPSTLVRAENFPDMQKLHIINQKISISHVYRNPRLQSKDFLIQLEMALEDNVKVVFGDFNYPNCQTVQLMEAKNFKQIITSNTHRKGSKLDLCFIRNITADCFIHPIYFSDHDCLVLNVFQEH